MATWNELANENLVAARELFRLGLHRPSVNRAYYAAYCAVTAALTSERPERVFRFGRRNPSHEKLGGHIERDLRTPSRRIREKLAADVELLRLLRESADYRPRSEIAATEAAQGLQRAKSVLRRLGVRS